MTYNSLFDLWKKSAKEYGNKTAFKEADKVLSYKDAFSELCFLADFFTKCGLKKKDNVCIFSENSINWLILEQAVMTLGAVSVAKNSIAGLDELEYVFLNTDTTAFICDKLEIIDFFEKKHFNIFSKLKFIIYTGKKSLENHNSKILTLSDILRNFDKTKSYFSDYENNLQDICYIHYTSGTSAEPKGAILINAGMCYHVEELQRILKEFSPEKYIMTFPLASAGGKAYALYCFSTGCQIVFTPYSEFFDVILIESPDLLHCAPKIMMTFLDKINQKIKDEGFLFEKSFHFAKKISKIILEIRRYFYLHKRTNTEPILLLKPIFWFCDFVQRILDKIILKKVRNFYFKDNMVVAVGSASFSKIAEDFYEIIGVNIIQDYGMSETTGLATHATIQDQKERPYSVGRLFSKSEFKIIDPETKEILPPNKIGLLLIKAPSVTKGYYNNKEAEKKLFTNDGWLITGDLASATSDNYLYIYSRYDDVIVLMNGYNVYAPMLQDRINCSSFISQAVVVGHGKPYLSALVVLNKNEYNKWCILQKINIENPNDNNYFKDFLLTEINTLVSQKELYQYYEKIKKIVFLNNGFSVENGFLTNTMKIKYRKICKTYADEIEKLYR